jgi:hypothetical protein
MILCIGDYKDHINDRGQSGCTVHTCDIIFFLGKLKYCTVLLDNHLFNFSTDWYNNVKFILPSFFNTFIDKQRMEYENSGKHLWTVCVL